jgi:hypothetical protein
MHQHLSLLFCAPQRNGCPQAAQRALLIALFVGSAAKVRHGLAQKNDLLVEMRAPVAQREMNPQAQPLGKTEPAIQALGE